MKILETILEEGRENYDENELILALYHQLRKTGLTREQYNQIKNWGG